MQKENDPYDGPGDTPDRPDVWIDQGDDGATVVAPGDNEPATVTDDGAGNVSIDFDQPMSDDSEPVDVSGSDDSGDDGGGSDDSGGGDDGGSDG